MVLPQFASHTAERRQLVTCWYEAYKLTLGRYLLRVLGDTEQAADALHDTFLRAYAALSPRDPPTNPEAWLQRIATNVAYTMLRKRKRFRWLAFGESGSGPDIERHIVLQDSIRRCLARLSKKEAHALLLFEYAGLSPAEIGALYGEEANTIRVRIFRARRRFRQLYEQEL